MNYSAFGEIEQAYNNRKFIPGRNAGMAGYTGVLMYTKGGGERWINIEPQVCGCDAKDPKQAAVTHIMSLMMKGFSLTPPAAPAPAVQLLTAKQEAELNATQTELKTLNKVEGAARINQIKQSLSKAK